MCKFLSRIILQRLFFLFFTESCLKMTVKFGAISKPIMDIFLQILDENWLDDT